MPTADAVLQGPPLVCQRCGTIGDYRVVTAPPLYRLVAIRCAGCGSRLCDIFSPPVLGPFGSVHGLDLEEDCAPRDIEWLHSTGAHPWVLEACCRLLGCPRYCGPSLATYYGAFSAPPKAKKRRASRR